MGFNNKQIIFLLLILLCSCKKVNQTNQINLDFVYFFNNKVNSILYYEKAIKMDTSICIDSQYRQMSENIDYLQFLTSINFRCINAEGVNLYNSGYDLDADLKELKSWLKENQFSMTVRKADNIVHFKSKIHIIDTTYEKLIIL